MRNISKKCAVELSWDEVRSIVSEEIRKILGLQIQCKVNVAESSFWDVTFTGFHLPLPRFCQLLQATQASQEEWRDALPDEGEVAVNGIGMMLAEKLISRHLKLTWEHHLITSDSLWLVDVTKTIPTDKQT